MTARFGNVRKLPSGNYQARYYGPDRNMHKGPTTFINKTYARNWLVKEQALILEGKWTPPEQRAAAQRVEGVTVGKYFEQMLSKRSTRQRKPLSPTTVDLYRKQYRLELKETFDQVALNSVTKAMISKWWSEPSNSWNQKGKAYEMLRSMFNDAVDDELIKRNPCTVKGAGKPPTKSKGVVLSIEELKKYLDAVNPHYRLILTLGGLCGLRSGELRGLRLKDVDLEAGFLHVNVAVTRIKGDDGVYQWRVAPPKTDAGIRSVAIPDVCIAPLRKQLQERASYGEDAFLFPARDRVSPMSPSTINDAHRKGSAAIGKHDMKLHDLRRTSATLAAQGGATIAELMRLLGHTTPQVAMIYQRATDEREKQRVDRLNKVINEAGW